MVTKKVKPKTVDKVNLHRSKTKHKRRTAGVTTKTGVLKTPSTRIPRRSRKAKNTTIETKQVKKMVHRTTHKPTVSKKRVIKRHRSKKLTMKTKLIAAAAIIGAFAIPYYFSDQIGKITG